MHVSKRTARTDQMSTCLSSASLSCIAIAGASAARVVLSRQDDGVLETLVDRMIIDLDNTACGRGYADIPGPLRGTVGRRSDFAALLVAKLLADAPARAATRSMPVALLPELLRHSQRILTTYTPDLPGRVWLSDDVFLKDLSICRLDAFAGVAQVIEQGARIPVGDLVKGAPCRALRLGRTLAANGFRKSPYLEIHTHTPMLDGFHPAGWDDCYTLAAQLLEARPDHLGMIGASWFYDPNLAIISPRLAYLAEVPRNGGAIFFRVGSDQSDVDLATATSPTRQRLAECGLYRPTRHVMIWPRKEILAWAAKRAAAGKTLA